MTIDDQVIIGINKMCDNALRVHWETRVMQTTLKNIRDLTESYLTKEESKNEKRNNTSGS